MRYNSLIRLLTALPVLVALSAGTASGQNARWPGPAGAEASALRAYGTGTLVGAMREAATEFSRQSGVLVNITAGPAQSWKQKAIRDGDIIFTDSEYNMTSLVQRELPGIIDATSTRAISLQPSAIIVRQGNPKKVRGIKDLGRQGLKLMAAAEPGQPALWEEAAKRSGGDKLVEAMRGNMAASPATSAEAQMLWLDDASIDAWLVLQPGQKQSPSVITGQEKTIYRACVMAITRRTPQRALAEEFIAFAQSAAGQAIFLKWSGQKK